MSNATWGLVAMMALTAGCAAPGGATTAAGDTDVVCTRVLATGTNIPQTRCSTAEERRRDAEAVRGAGDALNRSGSRGPAPQ